MKRFTMRNDIILVFIAIVVFISGALIYNRKNMGIESNLTGIPQFDKLELVKTGIAVIPATGTATSSVSVNHNLGYTPIVVASTTGGFKVMLPHVSFFSGGVNDGKISQTITIGFVTKSTVQFLFTNSTASGSTVDDELEIKYYLLRETSD